MSETKKIKNSCKNCLGCNQLGLKLFREKVNCKDFVYGGKEYDVGFGSNGKSGWKSKAKI